MNARERMIAILCGPGASCCMSDSDAASMVDELLDALTANPGNAVLKAGREHMMENPDEGVGQTFCAMIRAIKEGK